MSKCCLTRTTEPMTADKRVRQTTINGLDMGTKAILTELGKSGQFKSAHLLESPDLINNASGYVKQWKEPWKDEEVIHMAPVGKDGL